MVPERRDEVIALGCQGGRSQPWILAQVAADVADTGDLGALVARHDALARLRELVDTGHEAGVDVAYAVGADPRPFLPAAQGASWGPFHLDLDGYDFSVPTASVR